MQQVNEALMQFYGDEPLVFGQGPVPCSLMLIGEAPGAREIETGTPFCGQAGSNLQEFLDTLGRGRAQMYITNVCKFRPVRVRETPRHSVANRTPTAAERREAVPFLTDEIRVVDPKLIVTLGNTPLRALTGDNGLTVGEVHGQMLGIAAGPLQGRIILPLYHPASVIYNPSLRPVYLQDIAGLKAAIAHLEMHHG